MRAASFSINGNIKKIFNLFLAAIGINTSCTQPSQCTPYGAAYCIPVSPGRVCTCYDYAKYNEATELCEMKQGMGEYCGPTDPCKITNTVCTSRNTCECKPNFIAQNDECKPGYSAECEKTEDCAFENAECKFEMVNETESNSKQCKCNEDFIGIGNACYEKGEIRWIASGLWKIMFKTIYS